MVHENAKAVIESNPVAFATVDVHGAPNVIGTAYAKVVADDQILITDNYMSQTVKNLKSNNKVCLASWDKDWNGYKFVGTAEYFAKGKWKNFVEQMPENNGLSAKGAIVITVSKIIKLD